MKETKLRKRILRVAKDLNKNQMRYFSIDDINREIGTSTGRIWSNVSVMIQQGMFAYRYKVERPHSGSRFELTVKGKQQLTLWGRSG